MYVCMYVCTGIHSTTHVLLYRYVQVPVSVFVYNSTTACTGSGVPTVPVGKVTTL